MRHVAAALLVLVAACSDSTADSVVDAATTVEAWLASFDGAESPGTFVIDQQVTLLAALGRGEQATDIVAAGLTAETEADFWESFAATVERVAGTAMGELSVTAVDVVPVDGVDHSYVRLSGPSGSTTVIVEPGGSIDMLAMTGPGLVRPLRSLLVALPDGAVDGPTVATSLRTGLLNPRLDIPPQFYGETQDLIALIDR